VNLAGDKNADDERKDDILYPTIEDEARWISWVVENLHLITHQIFRFGVKALPIGNCGGKSLPGRVVWGNGSRINGPARGGPERDGDRNSSCPLPTGRPLTKFLLSPEQPYPMV
jgi:hypothetical protein